ncbi:MAG: hypothetical protein OHK0046_11670 [Anaerolineae bacterium]
MQDSGMKTIATSVIWTIWGAVALATVIFNDNWDASDEIMVMVMGLFILIATFFIWRNVGRGAFSAQASAEKSKRGGEIDKMAMLMQMMDDDEREAFKEALKQRVLNGLDGELPYDAAYYEEQYSTKRH